MHPPLSHPPSSRPTQRRTRGPKLREIPPRLGNHEFDFGAERTKELMNKSSFPWLGSNVRDARPPSNGTLACERGEEPQHEFDGPVF